MSKRHGPNKDNLEETRALFLNTALQEFVEHGYLKASTNRIVEISGMARGSLYYHFGDKEGLFRELYKTHLKTASRRVSEAVGTETDIWNGFLKGADYFLDLCLDNNFRKIVLVESQIALPLDQRLDIQEDTLFGILNTLIPELIKQGYFKGHTVKTAKLITYALLAELGRNLHFSSAPQDDQKDFKLAFKATMNAMRTGP